MLVMTHVITLMTLVTMSSCQLPHVHDFTWFQGASDDLDIKLEESLHFDILNSDDHNRYGS